MLGGHLFMDIIFLLFVMLYKTKSYNFISLDSDRIQEKIT